MASSIGRKGRRGRPKKRRPRHASISKPVAQVIHDVRSYFEEEKRKGRYLIGLNYVVKRTCAATKTSEKIVCKLQEQADVDGWDTEVIKKRERPSVIPRFFKKIIRLLIRNYILQEKKLPTLRGMYAKLSNAEYDIPPNIDESDDTEWKWGRETLRRFLHRSGFEYGKRHNHYAYTRERNDIVLMRDNYLEWIAKYRTEGYRIFYQDETWVFKNMVPGRIWQLAQLDSAMDVELKVPSGSGDRSIVCHLGSAETGLLEGCLLLFTGRKRKNPDYHSEMNSTVFLKWLKETVFPKFKEIGEKCVLVLDRAKYHTMLTEDTKPPTTQWKKQKLVDFVKKWGEPVPEDWPIVWQRKKTKVQLLEYGRKVKPTPKYLVQEIADQYATDSFCIKVIFLPVAHPELNPELNPIEMVWGTIKTAVGKANTSFKLSEVERMTVEEVEKYGPEVFTRFVSHAVKEEEKYREMGSVLDNENAGDDTTERDGDNVGEEQEEGDGSSENSIDSDGDDDFDEEDM